MGTILDITAFRQTSSSSTITPLASLESSVVLASSLASIQCWVQTSTTLQPGWRWPVYRRLRPWMGAPFSLSSFLRALSPCCRRRRGCSCSAIAKSSRHALGAKSSSISTTIRAVRHPCIRSSAHRPMDSDHARGGRRAQPRIRHKLLVTYRRKRIRSLSLAI